MDSLLTETSALGLNAACYALASLTHAYSTVRQDCPTFIIQIFYVYEHWYKMTLDITLVHVCYA